MRGCGILPCSLLYVVIIGDEPPNLSTRYLLIAYRRSTFSVCASSLPSYLPQTPINGGVLVFQTRRHRPNARTLASRVLEQAPRLRQALIGELQQRVPVLFTKMSERPTTFRHRETHWPVADPAQTFGVGVYGYSSTDVSLPILSQVISARIQTSHRLSVPQRRDVLNKSRPVRV